jgi:hypothetical protein
MSFGRAGSFVGCVAGSCSLAHFRALKYAGAQTLFGCIHMVKHGDSTPRSAAKGRIRSFLIAGVLILSIVVLVSSVGLLSLNPFPSAKTTDTDKTRPTEERLNKPIAELIDATGTVLVQDPGRPEWREVRPGTHLSDGDLIRTDISGKADIRYENGATVSISEKTIFTVRSMGDNRMEISVQPGNTGQPPILAAEGGASAGSMPFIEIQQIIPFGRSLELIGRVETGSSLRVNNEFVDVTGDGSFRHFTRPFPASAHQVNLKLRVTNLAGRSRIWTTSYNFTSPGGEK